MKDLTAKVFRTYNASYLFQKELLKISKKYEGKDVTKAILLDEFSMANAKVAIVMNHQKNVAKGYKGQIDNINKQIRKLRTQIKKAKESKKKNPDKIAKLEEKLKEKKSKKDTKMYMKNVSLETSKANYIDPRITVAFLKRHNIQPKDVFSSTLRQKFKWAFDAEKDYIF
jgi:DNA topoisomerase-1